MVMVAHLFGFASGDLFACLLFPVGLALVVVCWLVGWLGCYWC